MTFYEIREYTAAPGKLPAMFARFNDSALDLLEKRGLDIVFIGHCEFGEDSLNELVYVCRWDSYQQMKDFWTTFQADPEWLQVKADSEHDGPLTIKVRRRLVNTAPFDKK